MHRRLRLVIGATALIATLFASSGNLAEASSLGSTVRSHSNIKSTDIQAVTYRIVTKEGVLTYGWRPFTTGVVIPESASGCNLDVCISVTGSGTHVTDWNTQGYWDGGYICTHSHYWWGLPIRTGSGACGAAGVFFSDWHQALDFPNNSQLCNTWDIIPGKPCETVHR